MSGWEAMQQGAHDPFFGMTENDLIDEAAKNGEYDLPPKPQLLGTGLTIDPCAKCKHATYCSHAGACLRKEIKT